MTTTPVHTITDEQLAEIEALASKREESLYIHGLANGSVLALISRLRAAERDAARYRWIRESTASIAIGGDVLELKLDEAVDTVMQADK